MPGRARPPRSCSKSWPWHEAAGASSPAAASTCAGSPPTRTPRSPSGPSGGITPRSRAPSAWCTGPPPVASLALTGNLGRAWRAPTLFELFANGPHLGEERYEIGQPGLRAEAGTNVDVGLRWQARGVRGELTAYHLIGRAHV